MDVIINRELLKDKRLSKSWSQEQLAGEAGISLRTVQRIETDGVASLRTRSAIASALNLQPADLDTTPLAQTDYVEVQSEKEEMPWPTYLALSRYVALCAVWMGMLAVGFLILATLVGSIFFWEYTGFTFWHSVGGGIISAFIFIPALLLLYWLYRKLLNPSIFHWLYRRVSKLLVGESADIA